MIRSIKSNFFLLKISFFLNALNAFSQVTLPPFISKMDLISGEKIHWRWDQASRATVLIFLSTRCPCSKNHESVLQQLYTDFSSQGFYFLGVHSNTNESIEESKEYFQKAGLPFPILQDEDCQMANALGALKTPHAYVLSKSQEILFEGGIDNSRQVTRATESYLKNALMAIHQGRAKYAKEVRVLGCTIQCISQRP